MKLVRGFMRVEHPRSEQITDWTHRMDSLLCADEVELFEFISDGIVALAAKTKKPAEEIVDLLREVTEIEETPSVIKQATSRWDYLMAALGEHMPEEEARIRLAQEIKTSPWE